MEDCREEEEEEDVGVHPTTPGQDASKNATLLKGAKRSQIAGSKCKEVSLGEDIDCWPSKKAKGKQLVRYYRDIRIKMGGANLLFFLIIFSS